MNKRKNKGVTLIETIFYIVLFSMLSTVVISSIVTMIKSFREISIQRELTQGGEIVERISREIRKASGISSADSGSIVLVEKDENGDDKSVKFILNNYNVSLLENDVSLGNLNSENIKVSILNFEQITTARGKGIRLTLTISANNDKKNRTYDFYNTIVLRDDY